MRSRLSHFAREARCRAIAALRALRAPAPVDRPEPSTPDASAAPAPRPEPEPAWWSSFPFTTHRVVLGDGIETMDGGVPVHDDVRTDAVVAACGGSLAGRSIVDLGSNEGGFTLGFGQLGAERAVGIEARHINVRRADVARRLLHLDQVEFVEGDVKHELERLGRFDVVFASGILYHIADPLELLSAVRQACTMVALVDTHVAHPDDPSHGCSDLMERTFDGHTYTGRLYPEYPLDTPDGERQDLLWAAWSDADAFWPTEPDLVRMLHDAGFASVERLDPVADGDELRWGVDPRNRVLYLAWV